MTSRRDSWLLGFFVLLACGGPRESGAIPNETVYWKVGSSEVTFGACTDDPAFREQIKPVAFSENSYFVYRISGDGKKATSMACKTFDPSTCAAATPELVFDVAGTELTTTREIKSELGDAGCQLQTSQAWVANDKGTSMVLDVSNAMSLVDAPAECTRIENQVKAQSPNGTGFQGCVVTYNLGFTHN